MMEIRLTEVPGKEPIAKWLSLSLKDFAKRKTGREIRVEIRPETVHPNDTTIRRQTLNR